MSYEDYLALDASTEDGEPVYLYDFRQGEALWRYADTAENVVGGPFGSLEWAALPVTHDELTASEDMSRASLSVTLPTDCEVAQLFRGWMPEVPVTLTLLRWHRGPSLIDSRVVVWKGRVTQANWRPDVVTLELESLFTALQRNGCRARVQAMCRHALYETGCAVDKDDYAQAASITAVSGMVLTIPGASGEADGWWSGGHLALPDGSLRSIVSHTGASVTINRPSRYLVDNAPPVAVTLYPGCDHSTATCVAKFDNLENYGGFPFLPGINPFKGISLV